MGISAGHNSTNQPVSSEIWAKPDIHKEAGYSNFVELHSDGAFRLVIATRYGRKVMLKSVKQEYADDLLYQELLQKEFEILMKLDYNSIVRVHNIEDVPELGKCIVMEYVDGDTLGKFISGNNPNKKTKLHLLTELIQAIDYLHSKQIVHRDLKPTNIIVLKGGEHLKLIDFGLADSSSYELLKQPAGTSGYSSPEQQSQWKEDPRNDIYSMGKITEDLHLGSRYNRIIKTCTGDIQNRPSAKELLSMIEKIQKQNRLLAIAACFIGVVAIGVAATTHLPLEESNTLVPPATQHVADAPLGNDTTSALHQSATSPSTTSVTVITKKESVFVNPSTYKAYLEQGKKIVDADCKKWYVQMDTLSNIEYVEGSPAEQFMTNEPFKLHDFVNQYGKKLSKANLEAFMNELMNYYAEKTKRWIPKLNELNAKYEKEHWK